MQINRWNETNIRNFVEIALAFSDQDSVNRIWNSQVLVKYEGQSTFIFKFCGKLMKVSLNERNEVDLVMPLLVPIKEKNSRFILADEADVSLNRIMLPQDILNYGVHYVDYEIIVRMIKKGGYSNLIYRKIREEVEHEHKPRTVEAVYRGSKFEVEYDVLCEVFEELVFISNIDLNLNYYKTLERVKTIRDDLSRVHMVDGVKLLLESYDFLIDSLIKAKFYRGEFDRNLVVEKLLPIVGEKQTQRFLREQQESERMFSKDFNRSSLFNRV